MKLQQSTKYWLTAMIILAVGTIVITFMGWAGVPYLSVVGLLLVTFAGFIVFAYRAIRTDYALFQKKRGKKKSRKKAATKGVSKTKVKKKK